MKIEDETYLISNFISFVNYNGSETYLTNGAFLDVVVNQQLCKEGVPIILSNPVLYFTSFVENISDLMLHYHKKKYRERCENALNKLMEYYKGDIEGGILKNIRDNLFEIRGVQENCENDILECRSFKLMNKCIDSVIEIFKLNSGDVNTELFDNIIFPINESSDIENKLTKYISEPYLN
jgi:hypothetical protein